jgi:hypothetical protein
VNLSPNSEKGKFELDIITRSIDNFIMQNAEWQAPYPLNFLPPPWNQISHWNELFASWASAGYHNVNNVVHEYLIRNNILPDNGDYRAIFNAVANLYSEYLPEYLSQYFSQFNFQQQRNDFVLP